MSLLIVVTRLAWREQRFASSKRETIAISVASCKASNAFGWKRNSVSKFRLFTIILTKDILKATFALEWSFEHEKVGGLLILLDFSESHCSRTKTSLFHSSIDRSRFSGDLLGSQLLFLFLYFGVSSFIDCF